MKCPQREIGLSRNFVIRISVGLILTLLLGQATSAVELRVDAAGEGTVTQSRSGVPTADGQNFTANTEVTLTATPAKGWALVGWKGIEGNDTSVTLRVSDDTEVEAIFMDLRPFQERADFQMRPAEGEDAKEGLHEGNGEGEGQSEGDANIPGYVRAKSAVVVTFDDTNLEQAVRDWFTANTTPLGTDIYDTDLVGAGFTSLDASGLGITDLGGIEYCTDLIELDLSTNAITSVTELSGLTNLQALDLGLSDIFESEVFPPPSVESNSITDISSLSGLVNLIYFNVADNPNLTDISVVSNFTLLETLMLGYQSISSFSGLNGLSELQMIFAVDSGLDDTGFAYLDNKPDLYAIAIIESTISDLTPIDGSLDLALIALGLSPIDDISVFQPLTLIEQLLLVSCDVTDLQPLVLNNNFGGEDYLLLLDNPLTNAAICNDIPTILARMTTGNVDHDETCIRTLDVSVTGTGNTNPPPGVHSFDDGTTEDVVTFPTAGSGYAFDRWEGDASGNEPYISILMDDDKDIDAVYVPVGPSDYTVTISTVGNGTGTVYPGVGTFDYLANRNGTFFAQPDPGNYFGGWSFYGGQGSFVVYPGITLPIDGNLNLTAHFGTQHHLLTTAIIGQGSIDPYPGVYEVAAGVDVWLNGTSPDPGSAFYRWEGDTEGMDHYDSNVSVPMNQDRSITGVYLPENSGCGSQVGGSTFWGEYQPGQPLTIDVVLEYTGNEDVSAMGLHVETQNGWSFDSAQGVALPQLLPSQGATGLLEFAWATPPASFPADFEILFDTPLAMTGYQYIEFTVEYRTTGGAQTTEKFVLMLSEQGSILCNAVVTIDLLSLDSNGSLGIGESRLNSLECASTTDSTCIGTNAHSADQDNNYDINLSELLRVIQFFNSDGLSCELPSSPTEDGYQPGGGEQSCLPHDSDYEPQDWEVNLSELLRTIQFFNTEEGYSVQTGTEDGFTPGTSGTRPSSDIEDPTILFAEPEGELTLECGKEFDENDFIVCDNCGVIPFEDISIDFGSGVGADTPGVGTYQVEFSVQDFAETPNTVSLTRTVNVVDTTGPEITLIGETFMNWECGQEWVEPGQSAYDLCEDQSVDIVYGFPGVDGIDELSVGTNIGVVNYVASDSNSPPNTSTKSRLLSIVDTLPPTITLNGASPLELQCGSTFVDPGVEATDQCQDIDLTGNVIISGDLIDASTPIGTYFVYYEVTDAGGRTGNQTRIVEVVDTESPVIEVLGTNPGEPHECGTPYTDPGAGVTDNCDDDASIDIVVSGLIDENTPPGTHTIRYNATDGSTNEAQEKARLVTVIDTTPPIITLVDPTYEFVCGTTYVDPGVTVTDNCDQSSEIFVETVGPLPGMNTPGLKTVRYYASDSSGNISIAKRTFEVDCFLERVIDLTSDDFVVQCDTGSGLQLASDLAVDPEGTSADAPYLDYTPRTYYGAPLEPVDQILFGSGDSVRFFDDYASIYPNDLPALWMHYMKMPFDDSDFYDNTKFVPNDYVDFFDLSYADLLRREEIDGVKYIPMIALQFDKPLTDCGAGNARHQLIVRATAGNFNLRIPNFRRGLPYLANNIPYDVSAINLQSILLSAINDDPDVDIAVTLDSRTNETIAGQNVVSSTYNIDYAGSWSNLAVPTLRSFEDTLTGPFGRVRVLPTPPESTPSGLQTLLQCQDIFVSASSGTFELTVNLLTDSKAPQTFDYATVDSNTIETALNTLGGFVVEVSDIPNLPTGTKGFRVFFNSVDTSFADMSGITGNGDLLSGALGTITTSTKTTGKSERQILDIALSDELTTDALEAAVEVVALQLQKLNRPFYLRPGHEANTQGSYFCPENYRDLYRKVITQLREEKYGLDFASVWHLVPVPNWNWEPYYPGDDVVDWVGLSIYSVIPIEGFGVYANDVLLGIDFPSQTFTTNSPLVRITDEMMEFAEKKRLPVMICESSAELWGTSVGAGEEADRAAPEVTTDYDDLNAGILAWRAYFEDYWRFIKKYPHLKSVNYVNVNWEKQGFEDWIKESRLSQNEHVKQEFGTRVAHSIYHEAETDFTDYFEPKTCHFTITDPSYDPASGERELLFDLGPNGNAELIRNDEQAGIGRVGVVGDESPKVGKLIGGVPQFFDGSGSIPTGEYDPAFEVIGFTALDSTPRTVFMIDSITGNIYCEGSFYEERNAAFDESLNVLQLKDINGVNVLRISNEGDVYLRGSLGIRDEYVATAADLALYEPFPGQTGSPFDLGYDCWLPETASERELRCDCLKLMGWVEDNWFDMCSYTDSKGLAIPPPVIHELVTASSGSILMEIVGPGSIYLSGDIHFGGDPAPSGDEDFPLDNCGGTLAKVVAVPDGNGGHEGHLWLAGDAEMVYSAASSTDNCSREWLDSVGEPLVVIDGSGNLQTVGAVRVNGVITTKIGSRPWYW